MIFLHRTRTQKYPATGKALTLIELLVVLAVISLMVGIAAPAAKHLRQHAGMLDCQFRLRTLAVSLATYAAGAGGSLPPGPIEIQGPGSPWVDDPDRGSPLVLFEAARIGRADLSSQNGWYGQGLLWEGGYVEDGHLYYCPEVQRMDWGYDKAWPRRINSDRTPADGKTLVWSSYAYRGGLSSQIGTPNGPLNVYRNPSTLAVLADSPCFNSMWHEDGYNVAFIDTHVRFFHFDHPIVPDGRLQVLWQSVDALGQ